MHPGAPHLCLVSDGGCRCSVAGERRSDLTVCHTCGAVRRYILLLLSCNEQCRGRIVAERLVPLVVAVARGKSRHARDGLLRVRRWYAVRCAVVVGACLITVRRMS